MYAKMKELGPIGRGMRWAHPLDPPMPMVIDSLNLNLRQILPIYLRFSGNVPPGRDLWWKVAGYMVCDGATTDGEGECKIGCMVEMSFL